jgi:uncharacterized protein (DUF305 family)
VSEPRHAVRGRRTASAASLAAVVALALGGCSGTSDAEAGAGPTPQSSPSEGGDVTILQPGKPGESMKTVGPDAAPSDSGFNHTDIAFVQMMIPHHAQALEMSQLAQKRAKSEQVKALARRIRGAQGPEIVAFAAWLHQRNIEVPKAGADPHSYDHGQHGDTPMKGMLTEAQMRELAAARGREFDRLFLDSMITHHRGAVAMARTVAVGGQDTRVSEMAADVAAGQSAEIDRMRDLLTGL